MWTTLQKDKFNSGSIVITWSAIGSSFSISASKTCDILSFKSSHFYFHHEKMLDIAHYKKLQYTELQGKLPSSEMPSRNSCHKSNTSNPNIQSHIINMDFCIIFKTVCGSSTVSTMTRIYTERSTVQILAGATELSLPQNIQNSYSQH
jgi:hypothetical protein